MKKTLIIATILSLFTTQANTSVKEPTDVKKQPKTVNNASISDTLAKKISTLQKSIHPTSKNLAVTSHKQATKKPIFVPVNTKKNTGLEGIDDEIHDLLQNIESKATIVTLNNDKLSSYEANLRTKNLADRKFNKSYRLPYSSSAFVKANPKASPVLAAKRASRAAHSRSRGLCAKYVRKALQASGYRFKPNPSAYQYATRGTLKNAGFSRISNNAKSQAGDVVVVSRSRAHPHGHIAIYDGNRWVSDFRQKAKSPYSRHYPYSTWRDSRYLKNASSKGLYMATR